MKRIKYRTQNDGKQDAISATAVIDCKDDPGITRQEFADECDVNTILRKFNAGGVYPQLNPVRMGEEIDYNIDLQDALTAVMYAREAHQQLPPALRQRYPTWQALLTAIDNGELALHNTPPPKQEDTRETTKRDTGVRNDTPPQETGSQGRRPQDSGAPEPDPGRKRQEGSDRS